MFRNFEDIIKKARESGPFTISVAEAQDEDVLEAIKMVNGARCRICQRHSCWGPGVD